MLTATYSYAVISAELKQARRTLSTLEQDSRACRLAAGKSENLHDLKQVLDRMSAFHASLQERKIQTFIVPAIRAVSGETDALFAEFAFLNNQAENALQAARDILHEALFPPATLKTVELKSLLDHYFRYMRRRLTKEEELLLPAAWRVLPADTWFGIARQCLSEGQKNDDSMEAGRKRNTVPSSADLVASSHGTFAIAASAI